MNNQLFQIVFSNNPAERLQSIVEDMKPSKIAILVDENTKKHCLSLIEAGLPKEFVCIEIKSGEGHKNLQTCTQIWEALTEAAFDRKGLLVNLGGGVIGDMGGFCAATYKRGIRFINIPTTLLSQVDASVGGKLGIDFNGFKNHIGMFREPDAVIISTKFIETLDPREVLSGYAEVVKHAVIRDYKHFNELKKKEWEEQNWKDIVPYSVNIKRNVVIEDPTEKGLRKTLNFGHTIGHAIETFYLTKTNSRLLHGEAIAMGMVAEILLSEEILGMSSKEAGLVIAYIKENFPLQHIPEDYIASIIELTIQDKKNLNGKVMCALLKGIGQCAFDIEVDQSTLTRSIINYNNLLAQTK